MALKVLLKSDAEIDGVPSVLMIGSAWTGYAVKLRVRPVPRASESMNLFIVN